MNECLESNSQLVSGDTSPQRDMARSSRNRRAAFRSETSSWFPAVMLFLVLSFIGSALRAERLDDLWTITAGGQSVEVNLDGTFSIPNVASVDQDGDRIADDFLRIIGTARIGGVDLYAAGGYFRVQGGRKVTVSNEFSTRTSPPQKPERLGASVLIPTLTVLGQTTQVRVTATYSDGSSAEANGSIAGTSYRTSNPDIGTVSSEGVVTAVSQGFVFITAVNEGVSSVVTVIVAPASGFTSVAGFVRRQDGTPAIGSVVSISALGLSAIVGADGGFSFADVPTGFGELTVTAQFLDNGVRLVAVARQVSLVPNGISDAGLLSLAPFSLDRVRFITSGRNHAGGVRKDGSLWTWGLNSSGQLGDGSNLSRLSPVRVGADLD